uniref:WGS project CAEQ00000000 data, annotated contig 812 n=1 Tax=Trypanosoma congolense (strain IL3000) TaxID=1068625 RepID=F9WIL4_TRYCI|nr:unnamed protein product [Trypanosoma congolense IL3000]
MRTISFIYSKIAVLFFVAFTCPVSAVHTYAVFPLSSSGNMSFFRRATRRCARANMRLATPSSLGDASNVVKLLDRCGPPNAPVLAGGHTVLCSDRFMLFFWSPVLNAPQYPVEHADLYCGRRHIQSEMHKCEVFGSVAGRLFYQADMKPESGVSCTSPVAMDYDPSSLYQMEVPKIGHGGLLAWFVSRNNTDGPHTTLKSLEVDVDRPNRAIMGGESFLVSHVLCQGGRASIVSDSKCSFNAAQAFASLSNNSVVGSSSKGIHWLVAAFVIILALLALSLIVVGIIWAVSSNKSSGATGQGDGGFRSGRWQGSRPSTTTVPVGAPLARSSSSRVPSRSGSRYGNGPSQRPGTGTVSVQRQMNVGAESVARTGSFRGPPASRQGSFSENPLQRRSSLYGSGVQRGDSFRNSSMSRLGSFGGGNASRPTSLYASPVGGSLNLRNTDQSREDGSGRNNIPEQISISAGGASRRDSFNRNAVAQNGSFRGPNFSRRGSFQSNSAPQRGGLFNT